MDSGSKELPAPVREQLAHHPECHLSIESLNRILFQNGKGHEEKTKNYYLQCPNHRKQLIHSENREGPVEENNRNGYSSSLSPSFPSPFETMDEFLSDFFQIPNDRRDYNRHHQRGSVPFPFPIPGNERWMIIPRSSSDTNKRNNVDSNDNDNNSNNDLFGHAYSQYHSNNNNNTNKHNKSNENTLVDRERGKGVFI